MASKRTTIGIVLVIVFAVIALFIWIVGSGNVEGEAMRTLAEKYTATITTGDYEQAKSLTTPDFQTVLTKAEFTKTTDVLKGGRDFIINTVLLADQTVEGSVTDVAGKSHTIGYQLLGSGQDFKVANFKIDAPIKEIPKNTADGKPESVINDILLSDSEINPLGDYPVAMFSSDTPIIYMGVYTKRVDDLSLAAKLVYLKTGEIPVTVSGKPSGFYYKLGKGSFSGATFTIKKPTNGWPKGEYKMVITASNGDVKEAPFTIN